MQETLEEIKIAKFSSFIFRAKTQQEKEEVEEHSAVDFHGSIEKYHHWYKKKKKI